MNYLLYFFQLVLIQYATAQVITLGGRNFLNNQNCGNLPLASNFANNAGLLANIGQTGQLSNSIVAQNNLGQEYLISNTNYANNLPSNMGLANNIGLANGNIGLASGNIGLATSNIGLSNIGSETVVYNKAPMYANVVKPPREYGIEFSSGALSVGGNVEVNGRMPFNANVALNGVVPAQGSGAVDYKCDQLGDEEN
ncbi:uncharacterized protein LOC133532314 [Cydia pomonella]|uniref:uncharacterized protein LOC133532314 n=1 Tax=Cydia pomonella TaxID=82600 RepID=UPI002ADD4CE9|nr:uncharacterized protein LOC133532314 [Cydia pomonella]